jgi:hypothetical protein
LALQSAFFPVGGSQNHESFTPGQMRALQSDTQGGSGMPELGPYGSVRGARDNSRPYRDPGSFASGSGRPPLQPCPLYRSAFWWPTVALGGRDGPESD